MTATTHDADVQAYLQSVSLALADLSRDEREDLLAEVEASLMEAAQDGDLPLAVRLGSPEDFAAELRASAGLAPTPTPAPGALDGARAAIGRIAAHPRALAARRVARELAPAWWIARGYVAVATLATFTGEPWPAAHPLVPYLGNSTVSVAVLVAAVCASVWLGLRARRDPATRPRTQALLAANLVLALAAIPVAAHALTPGHRTVFYGYPLASFQGSAVTGIAAKKGRPVTNIYPYSRDGRLLLDVRLYDQLGRPLDLLGRDPTRRVLRTGEGQRILNSFPIRYREPRTNRVANPTAGPRITVPQVATPPLTTAP